ncbi:hypothetical protein HHL17_11520 [Chitinophaga sp. G-6-1-13]|uniref:Uncharacterized protein n=1 Tax=Chitinophaga fulva TaxID=2728842 RepID=A0A848GH88_9BACT|nr:hypothetical protein [Chitinophaga fulva]NML37824.1 hypothetical protein [Chitinophaga fulva]
MKPLIVPVLMLMISLTFACKKDHHDTPPPPPGENKPPVIHKPSVEFISMKVDGTLFSDSLTTKSYFQKTSDQFSMIELRGTDLAVGKAGKDKKALLYVRINFPGHEIKKGVYGTVTTGFDNSIAWQTFIDSWGLQDIYTASGNSSKHPDAPFRIEITRYDDAFIEGTFSGRAFGGTQDVSGIKEITEGNFKIARDSVVVLK